MREMKDSGIEWLGLIPESWEFTKISNLYDLRNTKVSDRDFPPLSVTMNGIVPQLDTAAKTDAHDSRKLVKKGDFAINSRSDRRGSCGISSYTGSVSLINTVMKPVSLMDNVYYGWLFKSSQFSDEFYKWGHGIVADLWTTNWQDMKNITIPYPPLEEQKKIAEILDIKCSEIDSLTHNILQQISQLEEYKKSVITETVTKGLVPDIGLKDSGIEWIGKIPKTWSVNGLKYVFNFKKGLSITKDNLIDNGQPVISYGQIHAKYNTGTSIDERLVRYVSDDYLKFNYNCLTRHGDFIFADTSEDLIGCGNAAYNDTLDEIFAGYHTIILSNNDFDNKYFAYLFQTDLWRSQIRKKVFGVKLFSITQKILKECSIIIPPKEERLLISNYLDDKCNTIDSIIESKQRQLTNLEEYKKTLIYECVTGKKEVL